MVHVFAKGLPACYCTFGVVALHAARGTLPGDAMGWATVSTRQPLDPTGLAQLE